LLTLVVVTVIASQNTDGVRLFSYRFVIFLFALLFASFLFAVAVIVVDPFDHFCLPLLW
jgi:hypothetical protein